MIVLLLDCYIVEILNSNNGKTIPTIKRLNIILFRISFSNEVWEVVINWDYFAKDTIGKQFVNAADSISANIAEGFGRYHKKDKVKFYYYSLGSVKECTDWCNKAKNRNLVSQEIYSKINEVLERLPREIHQLIKFTNEKLKS